MIRVFYENSLTYEDLTVSEVKGMFQFGSTAPDWNNIEEIRIDLDGNVCIAYRNKADEYYQNTFGTLVFSY